MYELLITRFPQLSDNHTGKQSRVFARMRNISLFAFARIRFFVYLHAERIEQHSIAMGNNCRTLSYLCRLTLTQARNRNHTPQTAEGTRIKLAFLPPYSPNFNQIERLWKFLRKKVINSGFYRTKEKFRKKLYISMNKRFSTRRLFIAFTNIALFSLNALFMGCASSKNTARMTLYLDENFNKEEQMCYISCIKTWISGNEQVIADSAKIKAGQKKVRFKVECPVETKYTFCFSKRGPLGANIIVPPKSRLKVVLAPVAYDSNGQLKVSGKGSEAENELAHFKNVLDSLQQKIECTDYTDSVKYYRQQMVDSFIGEIKSTEHPRLAFSYYIWLRTGHSRSLKEGELLALKEFLAAKFDHPSIQRLLEEGSGIPGSPDSHRAGEKIGQIRAERNAVLQQDTAIGGKLRLEFYDQENRLVSLDDIDSEYILVDFWASWCKPCQKEIPYLKQALARHKDKLCIYAVSIDRYIQSWKRGIERDDTGEFVHLIGSGKNGLPNEMIQALGIYSIPSNFLLDKDHRIVARNLRGEQLIQALDSLLKE